MREITTAVYVLDGDTSVRRNLHHLITSRGYNTMSFDRVNEFLSFAKPDVPSCLILDLTFAKANGLDLQGVYAGGSAMALICLAKYDDIRGAVKAMQCGASEVLSKPIQSDEVIPAVESALIRAEEERADLKILKHIRTNYEKLTQREREVLPFIVRGFLNKQTAYELGTSEITIRIHRGRIMRKMNAESLADLVRLAGRLGIPSPLRITTANNLLMAPM